MNGPQSIHAIGSMDLLYIPRDGVMPLLVHIDLPDMDGHHT